MLVHVVRSHVRSSRSRSYFKVQECQIWTQDLCFHCLTLPCSFSLLLQCTAVAVRRIYSRCRWPLVRLRACTSAHTHTGMGTALKREGTSSISRATVYNVYTSPWSASG